MRLNLLFSFLSLVAASFGKLSLEDSIAAIAPKNNMTRTGTVLLMGQFDRRNLVLNNGSVDTNISTTVNIFNNTFGSPKYQRAKANFNLLGELDDIAVIQLVFRDKNVSGIGLVPNTTQLPNQQLPLSKIGTGDPVVGNATVTAPILGLDGIYPAIFLLGTIANKTNATDGFAMLLDLDNGESF
jgi:hypothetical protein